MNLLFQFKNLYLSAVAANLQTTENKCLVIIKIFNFSNEYTSNVKKELFARCKYLGIWVLQSSLKNWIFNVAKYKIGKVFHVRSALADIKATHENCMVLREAQ